MTFAFTFSGFATLLKFLQPRKGVLMQSVSCVLTFSGSWCFSTFAAEKKKNGLNASDKQPARREKCVLSLYGFRFMASPPFFAAEKSKTEPLNTG